MEQPKVSVVILNWNGKSDTLECLDSVLAMEYENFDVVVVDNGSIDDSVAVIRAKFPWVTVLETGANLGYAGGNNVGIRHAIDKGARYVLVLNNDTVVDRALLTVLVRTAQDLGEDAILSAQIHFHAEPERVWYAGGTVDARNGRTRHERVRLDERGPGASGPVETNYASGCALFVGTHLLSRVGLFEERFFLMYEETDLCFRARRQLGVRSYVVPDARVWHKVSVSFGGVRSATRVYFLVRNNLLFAERNLGLRSLLRVYGHVTLELLHHLRPPAFRRPVRAYVAELRAKYDSPVLRARVRGIRDYVLRRFGNRPGTG